MHPEAGPHIHRTLQLIKTATARRAGLSVNPGTGLDAIDHLIGDVDLILVMSVNPGFGGQSFIRESTRQDPAPCAPVSTPSGRPIDLEVDGGITGETAPLAIDAGADVLVAGTATFKGGARSLRGEHRRSARTGVSTDTLTGPAKASAGARCSARVAVRGPNLRHGWRVLA